MTLIANKDFWFEVVKGNVAGHSVVHKFGARALVGTTLAVVSSAGVYQMPSTLTSLEVLSDDNTNDVAGGAGIRTVEVIGISDTGGSWTEETQEIALNGTTVVPVPNQQWRNFRLKAKDVGVYGGDLTPSHNSIVTLRVAAGGNTWSQITSEGTFGQGQSEIAAFTVPKGKTGYLLIKKVGVEGNKNVDVFMNLRDNSDTLTAPFSAIRVVELDKALAGQTTEMFVAPQLIGVGPTDMWFTAKTAAGTSAVSIEAEIVLVDD